MIDPDDRELYGLSADIPEDPDAGAEEAARLATAEAESARGRRALEVQAAMDEDDDQDQGATPCL